MTTAAPAQFARTGRGFAKFVGALPHTAFAIVIAVVVVCGAGLANVPSSWLQAPQDSAQTVPGASEEGGPEGTAAALPLAAPQAGAHTRRCTSCGVIESIRRLEPVGNLPPEFEFTVRLRDGSRRVSGAASQDNWRSGDRVMLMGGVTSSSH